MSVRHCKPGNPPTPKKRGRPKIVRVGDKVCFEFEKVIGDEPKIKKKSDQGYGHMIGKVCLIEGDKCFLKFKNGKHFQVTMEIARIGMDVYQLVRKFPKPKFDNTTFVCKHFGHVYYVGAVDDWGWCDNVKLYGIGYSDGDHEDMDKQEVFAAHLTFLIRSATGLILPL